MSKLYTDTKCRVINLGDMRIDVNKDSVSVLRSARAFLHDGTKLVANSHYCEIQRLFIMDHKEMVKVKRAYVGKTETEKLELAKKYLRSVTAFAKYFKKKIYIRMLPPIGENKENRVLTDEILEMIPIILKQQKTPIEGDDSRLAKYRRPTQSESHYHTLTITEFDEILNNFDIDKSKITLVPDISHELTRQAHVEHAVFRCALAPDMKLLLDMHQALNFLFDKLVMGVNWKNYKCRDHDGCGQNMKKMIMECLETNREMSEKVYVTEEHMRHLLSSFENECGVTYPMRVNHDILLCKRYAEDEIFINQYNNIVKQFQIPKYPLFVPASRKDSMLVWEYRLFVQLGWIQQFFVDEENLEVRGILLDFMYGMVPEEHVGAAKEFVNSIIGAKNGTETLSDDTPSKKLENNASSQKKHHKKGKAKKTK